MVSEHTKKAIKARNLFLVLQLVLMLGTVAFLVISTIAGLEPTEGSITEKYGTVLTSLGISLCLTTALLIVVGHKVRNTIWMGCLLLGSYLFGNPGLWVVFAIWCIDEYIIYPLYKRKQTQVITNKEIDKRQ